MDVGDTIVALATPDAPASRAVVRCSGGQAIDIARTLLVSCAPRDDQPFESRTRPKQETSTPRALSAGVHEARIQLAGLNVPGRLYISVAPASYTGEDSVEYHVPGNPVLVKLLLGELHRLGARPAHPGEFTARAYFNGRLNLTQAEGVAAMISARSEDELRAARRLASGELSKHVSVLLNQIAETLALVEVGIDFVDEDVEFISRDDLRVRCAEASADLSQLLAGSDRFERLSHVPSAVLVGRPNAGKSTLLNALHEDRRAVVSAVAGTTRDGLSVELVLEHGLLRLIDLPGLDDSEVRTTPDDSLDAIEQVSLDMQSHAQLAMESADFVILVRATDDDRNLLQIARDPDLVVVTKCELAPVLPADQQTGVGVSVHTGRGIDSLRESLNAMAFEGRSSGGDLALTTRHVTHIERAKSTIDDAIAVLVYHPTSPLPTELIAAHLREALTILGEIVGEVSPDEVLGKIFSRFCIGK